MFGNLCFAAPRRFEVPDQIRDLLLGQFRLGAKLHSAGDGLEAPLHGSFFDQLPLELTDRVLKPPKSSRSRYDRSRPSGPVEDPVFALMNTPLRNQLAFP